MLRCRNLSIFLPPFQHNLRSSKRFAKSDFANSWEESSVFYIIKDTLFKAGMLLCIVACANLLFRGNFAGNYTDKDDIYIPLEREKVVEPDTSGFVDDSDSVERKQFNKKNR